MKKRLCFVKVFYCLQSFLSFIKKRSLLVDPISDSNSLIRYDFAHRKQLYTVATLNLSLRSIKPRSKPAAMKSRHYSDSGGPLMPYCHLCLISQRCAVLKNALLNCFKHLVAGSTTKIPLQPTNQRGSNL